MSRSPGTTATDLPWPSPYRSNSGCEWRRSTCRGQSMLSTPRRSRPETDAPEVTIASYVSWQPELDEIRRREELARLMGGHANIERQHAAGRLTVRERIAKLLDPGSFHESGALAGQAKYDEQGNLVSFTPSNFVAGTGRIDSRPVVVGADDFTVRGGAADAAIGNKMGHAEKVARGLRMPMIRLVDGTGGGGSVKTIEHIGRTYVPANPAWDTITAILGEVPVVGACLGPVAGLGAVRVVTSHFSLMVRGTSQLFVAG